MTDEALQQPDRRRLLAALGSSAVLTGLAGCTGDGGDGSDGGDGEESPTDSPTASATPEPSTPSPTEEPEPTPTESGGSAESSPTEKETPESTPGSSGDAAFVGNLQKQERQTSAWDQFQSITVDFARIVLEREEGDPVELPVGEEVGLVAMESGEKREYVEETPIPSGTYRTAELYMPVQEATLSDGSEPSAELAQFDPVSIELEAFGDYMQVDSGTTVNFTATLNLVERRSGDGWRTAASWAAGYE